MYHEPYNEENTHSSMQARYSAEHSHRMHGTKRRITPCIRLNLVMYSGAKNYITLNLGPAACPVQAIKTALQLRIIETREPILIQLARANDYVSLILSRVSAA